MFKTEKCQKCESLKCFINDRILIFQCPKKESQNSGLSSCVIKGFDLGLKSQNVRRKVCMKFDFWAQDQTPYNNVIKK